MRRRAAWWTVFAAIALPALAYATLSGFARRPLSPGEAWTFGAAVVRATPAHLGGASLLETLRLGGRAFGSPLAAFTLRAGGRAYAIPLPPRTVHTPSRRNPHRFVTFASGAGLHAYLHSTLPTVGWLYREQFGSVHALQRGGLLLSVGSTFHAGTRVRELRFTLSAHP